MRRFVKQQGFTLFELVVVIALIGVAATLGGSMLVKIMDGWRRISVRAELDAMADVVFERMEKDFADVLSADLTGVSLVGITQTVEDDEQYFDRKLADDMIILKVRTSTEPNRPAAGTTVMYRVERAEGRHLLVQTLGDLATDMPIGGRIELIPQADVLRMRIEYAAKDGTWVDVEQSEGWFDVENLPRAVRVSLTLAHRDRAFEQVARSKVFPIHVD